VGLRGLRPLLLALAAPPPTAAPGGPACGCAAFCAGGCAFNATPPRTLALYRRTPSDDLRLPDHDTGTATGDADFSLYQFSYAYQCRDGGCPTASPSTFLQNDTVYAKCEGLRFLPPPHTPPPLPRRRRPC